MTTPMVPKVGGIYSRVRGEMLVYRTIVAIDKVDMSPQYSSGFKVSGTGIVIMSKGLEGEGLDTEAAPFNADLATFVFNTRCLVEFCRSKCPILPEGAVVKRASGNVFCGVCGARYWRHPTLSYPSGMGHVVQICDGDYLHL